MMINYNKGAIQAKKHVLMSYCTLLKSTSAGTASPRERFGGGRATYILMILKDEALAFSDKLWHAFSDKLWHAFSDKLWHAFSDKLWHNDSIVTSAERIAFEC